MAAPPAFVAPAGHGVQTSAAPVRPFETEFAAQVQERASTPLTLFGGQPTHAPPCVALYVPDAVRG